MRYIFFDVNGVLIDSADDTRPGEQRWTRHLERDLGIRPEDLTRSFFERSFDAVQLGMLNVVTALADILHEVGFDGTAQTLLNYWLENDVHLIPANMAIVKQLKARPGTRLFLATHQEKNRALHLWHELNFSDIFEEIYFSGRMGLKKTDHRFFDLIEKELSFEEEHCVLVDNDPAVIEAAKQAGWQTFLYTNPEELAAFFSLEDGATV